MKHLRVDILCTDGSPLQTCLKDVYGENGRIGLGGAELALHTLCEEWQKAGHTIRLYNNPVTANGSPYAQFPVSTFRPDEDRDVLIAFRSPNKIIDGAVGKKIFFSCDQFTIGSFKEFARKVDKIVTISPMHAKYFSDTYGIENTITIDLPVRLQDYTATVEKVPHRLIYCSVPDRGLALLAEAFPIIKKEIPDASLVVTSDYRLWGVMEPRNEQFVRRFLGMSGVTFVGAIPRREMVLEQMKAEIQTFPNIYMELFCIANAECQVAGAYPVTSSVGALATTNMAVQMGGNPMDGRWVVPYSELVIETLLDKDLPQKRLENQLAAKKRFDPKVILEQWESVLYD